MEKKTSLLTGNWAIEESFFAEIKAAAELRSENPEAFSFLMPEQVEENELLSIIEEEAHITISGPLVNKESWITRYFGGTSYPLIIDAIDKAEENDQVKKIIFNIDSPGGSVAGVDNAALAIKNTKKPTEARIGNMAASAAYWLATQANKVNATSLTARFGSIGVIVAYYDWTQYDKKMGIKHIVITSSGAPDKFVDGATRDGAKKIRAELDDIEYVFVKRVAEGRGVTTAKVLKDFGQGGVLIAEKAFNVGMIDKINTKDTFSVESDDDTDSEVEISKSVDKSQKPAVAGVNKMEEEMVNLKDLMAEDPAIAAEVAELEKAATEKGFEAGKVHKKEENRKSAIEFASTILATEDYPKSVKDLALKVVKGDSTKETLEAAVAILDSTIEAQNSANATDETETTGATPPKTGANSVSEDGIIRNENDLNAAVSRTGGK